MSGLTLFRIVKYTLFVLLIFNLFYYLMEDLDAYQFLGANPSLGQKFETFAVTIDYVAWMILVVLFELETNVFSIETLKGSVKWYFNGILFTCYAVVVYALYGFAVGLVDVYQFQPIPSETVCDLVGKNYAHLDMEARVIPLDPENCASLSGGEVFKHRDENVISDAPTLSAAIDLAWVDVVNASVWLLVVLLFELEVIWQVHHTLTKRRLFLVKASKAVLYLALLGAAIYWTVYGAFIDYWDAYIWLLAFILIDLNIFHFENPSTAEPAAEESI